MKQSLHLRLLLLFFVLGLPCQVVLGQAPDPGNKLRTQVVKVNMLNPLLMGLSGYYERAFAERKSFQLGVFSGWEHSEVKRGDFFRIFSLTPEMRFYLSKQKEALTGFYLAPYLRYRRVSYGEGLLGQTFQRKINEVGTGLLVGHQWVRRRGFTMDGFLGAGYYPIFRTHFNHSNVVRQGSTMYPIDIRLGFALGYAF
ncbi:hypothetical protein BH24BAC1_BH24BAC1_01560 [soil metagenome]